MIYLIIILTLLFFPLHTHAQEFTPYAANPVIKIDSSSVSYSQPFISKKEAQFSAWFSDYYGNRLHISTMKSSNGIDWYDKKTLQLSNTYNVGDPFMFEQNGEYQIYYSSSKTGPLSIWKSLSSDGFTFVPDQGKEVLKPEQSWERFSVSCPSVIQDSTSTRYMFYYGAGDSVWAIGMATSSDGDTWQKCGNNPLVAEGSSPQIVNYNNAYYLFYHSLTGLQVQKTDVLNGCATIWTDKHVISPPFLDPAPVVVGADLWLYGSYTSNGSQGIGLAGTGQIAGPTYPIVIIPGMFASWNADALLHNSIVTSDTWKMNPNISEYDAIIKTLENKGRVIGKDLFIFPYDWRKSMRDTTDNLDVFLKNTIWAHSPETKIQIIGHSLGGVVSRIYADKNPTRPIDQVVIAGAPLKGTVQSYKPLVAGEIDRENSLTWMAEKLILLLNKSSLQSDKETVTQKLPVLFDILPTFTFLKDSSGLPVESSFPNNLISDYPILSNPLIPQFYLSGSGIQTLGGYTVGERTALDTLFGLYQDGHPVSSWNEQGDGVALSKSALNQITPAPLQNHGEIIYSKESIKTILAKLDIQALDSEIPSGKATGIFPAILTFIQSPAKIQITHNGIVTSENEGMIHIQNTENGDYALQVTGQSDGEYTVSIWLIGSSEDKWFQFKKQIINGVNHRYDISFDGITGGVAVEYVKPTATPKPTATTAPTCKPTAKPTHKPEPTQKPRITQKPTPTEKHHKKEKEDHKKDKKYEDILKSICTKLFIFFRSKIY